jgi:hypothetical protein
LDQPAIELKPGRPAQAFNGRARAERSKSAPLSADASENLRHRLIAELEQLVDPEALAAWAQRALPLKNQLATADAQTIEAAFAARLSQLGDAEGVIAISKPVRERDRDHLRFVTSQPCLVCGRTPSDAHHIKFAEQRAMGRKVSDRFAVPICRLHHRELHRRGNERAWWQTQAIDPLVVAATLWARSHTVAPGEAEIVGDRDPSAGTNTQLNGRHFGDEAAAVDRRQNNETKPVRGPEGG